MTNNWYTITELNNETIKSMIYVVRGQKVMLDFKLAKIYGYETRYFNRQMNNNNDRFPSEFRFQLTKKEVEELVRCKNFTSSWGRNKISSICIYWAGNLYAYDCIKGRLSREAKYSFN